MQMTPALAKLATQPNRAQRALRLAQVQAKQRRPELTVQTLQQALDWQVDRQQITPLLIQGRFGDISRATSLASGTLQAQTIHWLRRSLATPLSPEPAPANVAPPDARAFARGAAQESTTTQTNSAPARKADPKTTLDQAQAAWLVGDWPALIALDKADLFQHRYRAQLAGYIATGYQQLGDLDATDRCRTLALNWGADRTRLRRLLYSGAYNLLGRASAAALKYQTAYDSFHRALALMDVHDDNQHNPLKARLQHQLADIPGLDSAETIRAILTTAQAAPCSQAGQAAQSASAASGRH